MFPKDFVGMRCGFPIGVVLLGLSNLQSTLALPKWGPPPPGTRVSQCGLGYQPDSANYITTCTDYNKVQWQCYTEQCHAGEAKTDPKVEPYWRFKFKNVEHLRETLPHPYIHSHLRRRVKMANWRLLKLGLSAMTVGRNDPPGFLLWYNSQRPSKPFFQMSFLSLSAT
ncbi:hypothetical protein KEM48_009197 [Puccinia striiformis f. sp. tritici PST-130]|nr:hypothetical protein KEM48_009197 [Puccinia striiformis f. sp. tritici PST-130]